MRDTLTSAPKDLNREADAKPRRDFQAEMRAKGYKRVVRWVLDTSNPVFATEYKRQLDAIAAHQRKHGAKDFFPPEEDVPGWS